MEKINQNLLNLNYDELKALLIKEQLVTTLVYTPTCGTCHVAKKMLEVVKAAKQDLVITMINLNYNANLAEELEIMSVPCIIIYKNGEFVEKIYAFEYVPYLYKKITSYL